MKKITFIGAAGCGKTTLSSEIFVEMKKRNINAELIYEWIRYDIQQNSPMKSVYEQYRTLMFQQRLEMSAPTACDYHIIDSGTLTPYFYSQLYCDPADARQRLVLQDMFKFLTDDLYTKKYDYVFFLPLKNLDHVNDGTRYQTEEDYIILDKHMDLFFNTLNKLDNVFRIDGEFAERKQKIMDILCL